MKNEGSIPASAPREKRPSRPRKGASQHSIFATLYSPSREREFGSSARTAVAVDDKFAVQLPCHIQSAFRQLESNLTALEKMFRSVATFTQTEAFMASAKGSVLLQSQREVLADVIRDCEAEISFLAAKVRDASGSADASSGGLFASPVEKSSLVGWQSVYSMLASAARVCNAQTGALFVRAFKEETSDGTVASTPQNGRASHLQLACYVSAQKLTPLANGTLHLDVLDVAESVFATKCSVNARAAESLRTARSGFQTILACPVEIPRSSGAMCGVIVLLDRVFPANNASAKLFSEDDESRLHTSSELVAEVLSSFKLLDGGPVSFVTPTTFENTWNIATREESVLRRAFREQPPKGYIFRDNGVAPLTSAKQVELQTSKSRSVVAPMKMIDLLGENGDLHKQIVHLQNVVALKNEESAALKSKMALQISEMERAFRLADSMKLSNELLLRNSFVQPLTMFPEKVADGTDRPAQDVYDGDALSRAKRFPTFPKSVGPQSARRTRTM